MSNQRKLPTPEEFLLDVPLYEWFEVTEADEEWLASVKYFSGQIHLYCERCDRPSIFSSTSKTSKEHQAVPSIHWSEFTVILGCARQPYGHDMRFYFVAHYARIAKVGQLPSLADIHLPLIKKYRAVLGKERFHEFAKGVGLAAHGVGIGSFVYLRRVLEGIISDAYDQAINDSHVDPDEYAKARMQDKIGLLSGYLPKFLVQNRAMYAILSQGIHELNEQDCLRFFPAMKNAIEMTLDERLQEVERKRKTDEAAKAIAAIRAGLKE